jgi:hypothetical protein
MRSEGSTSLLVMEIPHGTQNIGYGIEESVVDGVIQQPVPFWDQQVLQSQHLLFDILQKG